MAGVYMDQRLNLPNPWEGPRKKCQGFKPDSGNLTVRDYRGASGIVSHGEDGNPSGNRKSRNGNPSPTAERARFLSQCLNKWTITSSCIHLDLCLLFNSWANRCADYVQTDGGGRGIDLNTLDYWLANVERFGLAM